MYLYVHCKHCYIVIVKTATYLFCYNVKMYLFVYRLQAHVIRAERVTIDLQ